MMRRKGWSIRSYRWSKQANPKNPYESRSGPNGPNGPSKFRLRAHACARVRACACAHVCARRSYESDWTVWTVWTSSCNPLEIQGESGPIKSLFGQGRLDRMDQFQPAPLVQRRQIACTCTASVRVQCSKSVCAKGKERILHVARICGGCSRTLQCCARMRGTRGRYIATLRGSLWRLCGGGTRSLKSSPHAENFGKEKSNGRIA